MNELLSRKTNYVWEIFDCKDIFADENETCTLLGLPWISSLTKHNVHV